MQISHVGPILMKSVTTELLLREIFFKPLMTCKIYFPYSVSISYSTDPFKDFG